MFTVVFTYLYSMRLSFCTIVIMNAVDSTEGNRHCNSSTIHMCLNEGTLALKIFQCNVHFLQFVTPNKAFLLF